MCFHYFVIRAFFQKVFREFDRIDPGTNSRRVVPAKNQHYQELTSVNWAGEVV